MQSMKDGIQPVSLQPLVALIQLLWIDHVAMNRRPLCFGESSLRQRHLESLRNRKRHDFTGLLIHKPAL